MSLNRSIPQYLYHKSSVINRESILCGGLNTLQLDKRGFELDPDEGMIGCFTYDAEIPCSFCKIIYKGTGEEL